MHTCVSQYAHSSFFLWFYQLTGFAYWNCTSLFNSSENNIDRVLNVFCAPVTVLDPLHDIKNVDFFFGYDCILFSKMDNF